MRPEHKFLKTREEWEKVVFEEADHFTCCRFVGRKVDSRGSKFKTNRHPNFLEAVYDATVNAKFDGRQPMIYAVAPSGRNVLVPRDQWIRLLMEFAERNPEYEHGREANTTDDP